VRYAMAAAILAMAGGGPVAAEFPDFVERRVVVSIPDRMAALLENGLVVKTYRVAVGAPGTPSPVGEFRIVSRVQHPTYYRPGVVIRPGQANPIGTRWIGLDRKGYGLHGTNAPKSIGKALSLGCIRFLNRDVEELFDFVAEGDIVELHGERDERVAQIFDFAAVAEAGR
jgi:L,D-transpeptidase ErfK/SrfK